MTSLLVRTAAHVSHLAGTILLLWSAWHLQTATWLLGLLLLLVGVMPWVGPADD